MNIDSGAFGTFANSFENNQGGAQRNNPYLSYADLELIAAAETGQDAMRSYAALTEVDDPFISFANNEDYGDPSQLTRQVLGD